MFNDSYEEFRDKATKAAEVNKGLKFPRYGKNLRFNSAGVYSYGAKIATLDLGEKTIQRLGYWSPTTSKHYNYAAHLLNICYDFRPIASHDPLVQVQHLSYDDHS